MIIRNIYCPLILLLLTFLPHVSTCPIPFDIQSKCRCAITETGRVYIYCARKQLKAVPHFNNSNIIFDELVLSGNQISIVHKNAFNGLKLRKLELQSNPLVQIEANAFVDLANYLEELIISTTLSSSSQLNSNVLIQILSELPNLKRLSIRSFDLSKSWNNTNGIFSRKLTQLSLQACSIGQIDDIQTFISLFPNIERLDFSENRLEHFDIPLILALKKLKILTLSKNKIRHLNIHPLSSSLIPSNSLIELDLSYNGIETIDEHIFELFSSHLESLNLRNNELATEKHLTFLIHLYHLREFYLDYNRLESINQLYLPVNLKILSLKYNRLHRIDLSILVKLGQLEKLALSYNQLTSWTSSSSMMNVFPSLEMLELDRNQLSKLSSFAAPKLKQLNLDGNRLGNTIDRETFANLPLLERLQLRDNQIDQIDTNAFVNTRLQALDLRNNSLSTIPLLTTLNETLQVLSLRRNRLCTLEQRSLNFYRSLVTLELDQNPLHCDCRMGTSIEEWFRTKPKISMTGQCESPPERRNFNLIDVSNEHLPCSLLTTPQCTYLTRIMIESEEETTTKPLPTTTTIVHVIDEIVNERQQQSSSSSTTTTTDEPSSIVIRIADLTVTPMFDNSQLLVQWQLFPASIDENMNNYNEQQHRAELKRHGLNGFKISSNSPVYKLSELLDVTRRNFTIADVQQGEICLILMRTISYEKHCKQIELPMIATTETLKSSLIIDNKQQQQQQRTLWYMNEPAKSILIGSIFGILFVLILITFVILLLTRCPHILLCRLRPSKYHQSNDAKSETLLVRPTPTNTIPWPSSQPPQQQHLYHPHHQHRPVSYQPSLSTQCTCPTHYHSSGSSSTGGSGSNNGQNYHIYQEILNDDFHPQTLLRQPYPHMNYHTQHRTCRPLAIETSPPTSSSSANTTTTTSNNSEQCQLCSLSVLV